MKRRWLVVSLLVGVLSLAVAGGTILAQSDEDGEGSLIKSFAARVATILGLDEDTVQDAFDQANREMHDEGLEQKLDQMVEEGLISPEDKDAQLDWYKSRPDSIVPGFPGMKGHGFRGRGPSRGMWFGGDMQQGGGMWQGKGFLRGRSVEPPVGTPIPEGDAA